MSELIELKMDVVMAAIIDSVAIGLVASRARPGDNVTGISWRGIGLTAITPALWRYEIRPTSMKLRQADQVIQ